ncbi:hypothetical protein F511_15620 [Dorcoceras hygrometricum]|uniref:FHA domain-containing protein n=1 Tax=Dorcoceras hygrometricum TaxID=472368 RepID=A0A2Z7AQ47_9LAMI|nr:hypothetical protein F511_15620 [Dorcoceras hygrometricum]
MEIVTVEGSNSKILINPGQTRELGRDNGLNTSDRTISQRHVSFFHPSRGQNQAHRLQFEVIGVNPIYVCRHGEVKVFRRFERGEMESGDRFCLSAKNPVWYTLRDAENGGERVVSELAGSLESEFELNGVEDLQMGDVNFSGVDHVKEFGLVVMGHEFDSYPKKMIRDIKNWNWFLEESGEDSEDDENKGKKAKVGGKRKREKGREKDDEDWTGETEDDKELLSKSRMSQKPNYMTRSKDVSKPRKSKSKSKTSAGNVSAFVDEEDIKEEDEDDETLGGFVVEDDNLESTEESGDEEEEEEEELEDDYDDDE